MRFVVCRLYNIVCIASSERCPPRVYACTITATRIIWVHTSQYRTHPHTFEAYTDYGCKP